MTTTITARGERIRTCRFSLCLAALAVILISGTTISAAVPAQQAYLKASNTVTSAPPFTPGDLFGSAVAVSGDTVVVGARYESSNGDQNDNSVYQSGAAYVFVRSGTNWHQQAYLKASNPEPDAQFGFSVAVSGDTIVVGAPWEHSSATGVSGGAPNSGAAYVFVRKGRNWTQQAFLKASNAEEGDTFGVSVGISGDTIVAGAYLEDSNATGVNGNERDNGAGNSGAAYVFVRNGTAWFQQAYLKASNTEQNDYFGFSVAVSDDTVVVGAYLEDSGVRGISGNQSDNTAEDSGAAYVFVRHGRTWSQQAYLKASNTSGLAQFGVSVAVSEDTVVVGAYGEGSGATGVNGNQFGDTAGWSGAAYVFVRHGTKWHQQAYLKASNTDAEDYFGVAVSVHGDTIAVVATGDDSSATTVNGDARDNSATDAGAAYVFVRRGTHWTQQSFLKASNAEAYDYYGQAIAVFGDTVVVGAYGESSNARGVNGNQSDNSIYQSGAAYVYSASGLTPKGRSRVER